MGTLLGYVLSSYSYSANIIRIGHDSKENSPLHQGMLLFKKQVETDSKGKIRVEIYPARQLGGVRETTELVRQGNLQMTVGASVLLTSIVPEFNVLDMFYLFRDAAHAHRALDSSDIGEVLLRKMESKGFHGLGFMEVGFRNITNNKRPIVHFKDLKGLKIRAASNPYQIEAWKSVGTMPIPLSWGEIFTSLQQGLINAQESAVYSVYAERFYEVQKYLSLSEHIYTNYVWFANKIFWDQLSKENQSIINRAAKMAVKEQRLLAGKLNSDIIIELEKAGLKINTIDIEVRKKLKNRFNKAVSNSLRNKTGSELFDAIILNIDTN